MTQHTQHLDRQGVLRSRKIDGGAYYDCLVCRGRGKLEISSRGLWFCHKCSQGGALKGFRVRIRNTNREAFKDTAEYLPALPIHLEYLKRRGLTDEQILVFNPHYRATKFYYVFSPIYVLGGTRPEFYVGRHIFDAQPKYYYCPGFQKSNHLWGLHRVRPNTDVVLCEGVFDALPGSNRIALLGKTLADGQVSILRRLSPKCIHVLLDGDAWADSVRVCTTLAKAVSCQIYSVRLPADKDPWDIRGSGDEFIKEKSVRIA